MIEQFTAILRYSAPVGLAALGETVAQKAGLINIGLEGTMLTAAYSAMVATQSSGSPIVGLAAGIGSALVVSVAQAWFTVKAGSDQVVVGTAVNLLSLGVTSTLFRSRYGNSGQLLSVEKVPRIWGGLDLVLVGWMVLVLVLTWTLFRTRWGLIQRATGENPTAVVASGFQPATVRFQAVLVAGALAGLAAAYLSIGIAGSFAENMTAGRGFVAMAMVTFGRWKPIGVFGASLLIGYADSLQFGLQARGVALPPQALIALPYVIALLVLVIVGKGTSVPEALGRPLKH